MQKTRDAEKQSQHMKKLADAATTKLENVLPQLQVLVANSGFPHITQLAQDPIRNHISLITAFGLNACQSLQVGGRARACLVCTVSGPEVCLLRKSGEGRPPVLLGTVCRDIWRGAPPAPSGLCHSTTRQLPWGSPRSRRTLPLQRVCSPRSHAFGKGEPAEPAVV